MEREVEPPVRTVSGFVSSMSSIWRNFETTRNFTAFFFFGLTNNFGYVIMLSAALDLLKIIDDISEVHPTYFLRECNAMSTGALLLANIVPSTLVKLLAPFLPLCIHLRMTIVVTAAAGGLILVGMTISRTWIIVGICLVSVSQGLGETSLLAYTVFFKSKNILSTWSSGTGLAGLLGSFAYSFMIQMGFSPKLTIFCMLCMPLMMAIMFWFVVEKPIFSQFEQDKADLELLRIGVHNNQKNITNEKSPKKSTFYENVKTIPSILKTYTLWYGLVYLFEYFINQGMFESISVPNYSLDNPAQYRWFNTLYQLGVFLSRSSMSVLQIDRLYLTALFQGINVVIFSFEAVYGFITYLPIVFALILWEGLLGGACYVNTFRLISTNWPREGREFAMAFNSLGDSFAISAAGLLAIPTHNVLCNIPPTYGRHPLLHNSTESVLVSPAY